jgi:alpha-glucan, water dikinase
MLNREAAESEHLVASSYTAQDDESGPFISLVKKQFPGKYAISADEFSDEMVVTLILS